MVYSESNISKYALSYMNIYFFLVLIGIIYLRLNSALIFNGTVYHATIITESMLLVLFLFAALRDFVIADRNFIFHIIMVKSALILAITSVYVRDRIRYKFLSKVDFAFIEKDFEALVMMFTLHELIERSSYDDK